jgi:pyruvate/2-oxoglutarate dehydrogenase complex dihydrolipoamide dehydrogenase (E3) component
VLPREDPDAAALVQDALERDGVDLRLGAEIREVWSWEGSRMVELRHQGRDEVLAVDEILVAVGRAPNVDGLDLDAAGVRTSRRGVDVDQRLRTSNRRVYAAGDVASRFQFTHTADAQARIVLQNALLLGRKRLVVPALPGLRLRPARSVRAHPRRPAGGAHRDAGSS